LVKFSDGFFFFSGLDSIEFNLTLGTSLESSNCSSQFFVVIEVSSEGSGKIVQFSFVFLSYLSQSDDGGILLVN
jgi:hypothetical protein